MNIGLVEATLAEQGWVTVDLPDPSPVFSVRDQLLGWLRQSALPGLGSLGDYHRLVAEEHHVALLHDLAAFYWRAELGTAIVAANLELFRRLISPDLHIQRYPYLRVVRPDREPDAAPLHRDTYYGASPYELSVVVPFTDMPDASAIRVVSGSHVAGDADYPYVQQQSLDVAAHSPKHQLGFPYAPRVLDPALNARAVTVPLVVGQALVFGLSLVHGGGVNGSAFTRVSTDIRLANSLAPVAWSRGVHPDYFVPLCSSVVSESARRYLHANQPKIVPEP